MKKSTKVQGPKYPVQTLEKTFKIIELLFKEGQNGGLGISELSSKLEIGKSNIHRILDTLVAYNYVEKSHNSSKYCLGWKVFEIGNAVPRQRNLYNFDYTILQELCDKYNETVNIGVRVDKDVVTISKVEPSTRLMANVRVGGREPLYATSMGKMLISELSNSEILEMFEDEKFESYTQNTITSVEQLIAQLKKIRKQGYSIDDEEFCTSLSCIAMPIRNYNNEIVASVSVSGITTHFTYNKITDIRVGLGEAVQKLSTYFGYTNTKNTK